MKLRTTTFTFCGAAAILGSVLLSSCGTENADLQTQAPVSAYFGHRDSAYYVGMQTCRTCHADIYETFIRTGMGKSFAVATRTKSAGDYSKSNVYDRFTDLHYHAFWSHDSLYMREYRVAANKRDTLHSRTEQVNYIVGSGQHTNSHIRNFGGYLHQMPMTFYTQEQRWNLPPGFENGVNTRFARKIGLECMSCHNAIPGFVMGSENKFTHVPEGIDCERCHGPGSYHAEARRTNAPVDISREIDYTIVNPAKLPVDLQFDICQRCHLQGNAVLREGKSFLDFKPGQKLSDYISVFMPRYEGADDEFIMASHAERLKMSPCFIQSATKAGTQHTLRPYKDAMTCVTCHNPHVSVTETGDDTFNAACNNCHAPSEPLTASHQTITDWKNCVSCHMPLSGSTDIPHVTVHDHYIRKPVKKEEKEKIKKFLGLYAVNEKSPDAFTRARAYLSQYEKFATNNAYLDSAEAILNTIGDPKKTIKAYVQLYFQKRDFTTLINTVKKAGDTALIREVLNKPSYDNADAWTCYRIGEAILQQNDYRNALPWLKQAVKLTPYFPDFRNKLGTTLAGLNAIEQAADEFEFIIRENSSFVSAYANLGYLRLMQGMHAEALRLLKKGLSLDPDNEPVLMNLAAYHLGRNEKTEAATYLRTVLAKNPSHAKARAALKGI